MKRPAGWGEALAQLPARGRGPYVDFSWFSHHVILICRSARHDGTAPLPAFDPARPYNALPALPPATDIESRAILRACIEARAALAALKAAGSQLPNQAVLVNTLPLM